MAAAQMSNDPNDQLLASAIGVLQAGFLNNLSGAPMVDPVQLPDGLTYERTDITNGLVGKYPVDSHPLMIPNYTIRNIIIAALQNNDGDELELALSCPITQSLFVNPVICSGDGHTFSKLNIEQWLVRDNPGANFMTSPSTQLSCGELIANRTLIGFMERMGLQPTSRYQAPATRRVDLQTLLTVVPKILNSRNGHYSRKTKEFLLLYLQNQRPKNAVTSVLLRGQISVLRRILGLDTFNPGLHGTPGGGYKIYKSKSKINKRKHSRKRKYSRKRG